jgi:hypothetical protein
MPGVGINETTGAPLDGWPHVLQSIRKILTTSIGTRVMRREFGSEVMSLIDAPMEGRVLLAVYVAVANAIARWEPRFRLSEVQVDSAAASGTLSISLYGTYYPRGHLGDFTSSDERQANVLIA